MIHQLSGGVRPRPSHNADPRRSRLRGEYDGLPGSPWDVMGGPIPASHTLEPITVSGREVIFEAAKSGLLHWPFPLNFRTKREDFWRIPS